MFFYWLKGTIFTLFNFTFRATFDQKSNELLKLIKKEGTTLPQKQSLVWKAGEGSKPAFVISHFPVVSSRAETQSQ